MTARLFALLRALAAVPDAVALAFIVAAACALYALGGGHG